MLQYVKNLKRLRCVLWAIVLFLLVLIFIFSAQTGEKSGDTSGKIARFIVQRLYADFDRLPQEEQASLLEKWNFVLRKGAHFTEYAVLAFAVYLLLCTYPLKNCALLSWLSVTAYAGTDELHQLTVAERAGSMRDVLLDSGGALFGMTLAALLLCGWCRRRKRDTEGRK